MIKRSLCLASVFMGAVLFGSGCAKEEVKTGAYTKIEIEEKGVWDAAHFAVKDQERRLREVSGSPVSLELVSVVSAEKQVVAGVNYKLLLEVRENGRKRKAFAVVWWQAWRKPHPYHLTLWTWR